MMDIPQITSKIYLAAFPGQRLAVLGDKFSGMILGFINVGLTGF
jgi:hypothetical protein